MIHYQGEDINFYLTLDEENASWKTIGATTIYIYTQNTHIAKFYYKMNAKEEEETKVGYNPMHVDSSGKPDRMDDVLFGVLGSKDTKLMHGSVYMDIYVDGDRFATGASKENGKIKRVITGMQILSTPIKREVP